MIEVEVGKNQSLENLDEKLGEIGLRLKNMRNQSDKTSNSMSAGFKASAASAALIPGPIGMAATGMQGLTAATSTFIGAMKGVKGILISTGIGAFVVLVGTLITYFTETEKGAQKLRTIMAGLGAVVRTVADAMMSLDFRSLTTDLKENTQAAIANAKALNAVEEAEGELTVKRAEANKEITRARLIADDLTRSTEERIEAVKRAGDIEKQVAAEEMTIQRQRLAAMESNLNMKKDASEEERDLLEQAQVRLADLERETLMREKRLGSEVQSLKNEQAAKDKEADAARLEAVKARNEKEAELAKQKAEAEKKAAEEAVRLAKEAADRQQTIEEYVAERKARSAEEQLQLEIDRALQAEEEKFKAVMAALELQGASEDEKREATLLMLDEQMALENEIRYKYDQERLTQAQATADEEARINKEKADKIKAQEQELRDAKVGAARATAGALGQIGALIEQQQGEATAASKAFAIAQVLIDTATSISSAIAGATAAAATTPSPATPFLLVTYIATMVGAVVGAIASATSILDSVPGGGSASGAVAGVASATSAPSVQPVTTNTTQLNNTEQAELMPIQAYVVETAITGSQGNVTQIESQATFGGG
jgi:hypothetical protein